MQTVKISSTPRNIFRRLSALAAVGVVGITFAAAGAGPAHAQPANGTTSSKGCPVEDEHGNVSYVPVGTQVGLFHCGADGDWHFGWLTNGRIKPPSHHLRPLQGAAVTTASSVRR